MKCFFAFLLLTLHSFGYAQIYHPVDATSKVSFKIKNFGSTVDGRFTGLKGTISFDGSTPSNAKFDVTIEAVTINTGIGMRDNHLRKADYFGTTDFPTLRFVSTKVVGTSKAGESIIIGKLTIKKTTKEVTFPFRYSESNGILQFVGEFKVNRRHFDIGGGSISLADELVVMLDVKASKLK